MNRALLFTLDSGVKITEIVKFVTVKIFACRSPLLSYKYSLGKILTVSKQEHKE